MRSILVLYVFLIAVIGGFGKPYCLWHTDEFDASKTACLETADATQPSNISAMCADEVYTQLTMNIQYCFGQQDPLFKGCANGTDVTRCSRFELRKEESPNGHESFGEPLSDSTIGLCLPLPSEDSHTPLVRGRNELLLLLNAVNMCEGRRNEVIPSDAVDQDLNPDRYLRAPCTCNDLTGQSFNASLLCQQTELHARAVKECRACHRDWDNWLNDFLGWNNCLNTAVAAAPIQAFCRSAATPEDCARVNDHCESLCGGATAADFLATVDSDTTASGGDAATAPDATTPPPPEVGAQTPAAATRASSG